MGRLLFVGRVVLLMLGELSYECGASCLGTFMWGDLSWGELSLVYSTRRFVVCLSVCHFVLVFFQFFLVLRLPRLGKREPIFVLFLRLFGLYLFRFVGFLFLFVLFDSRNYALRKHAYSNI